MLQLRYSARFIQELNLAMRGTKRPLETDRHVPVSEREIPLAYGRPLICLTSRPLVASRVVRGSGILTRPERRSERLAAWQRATPDEMIAHVIGHCFPDTIAEFGVGFYDIDACRFRGIRLEAVVEWALAKLKFSNSALTESIDAHGAQELLTAKGYRLLLVKTILYIWQQGLAIPDWERLEVVHPGAREVTLNLRRDSNDIPFDPQGP